MVSHILYLLIGSLLGLSLRLPFAVLSMTATDAYGEYSKLVGWAKKRWNDYRMLDAANAGTFPRPSLYHYLISRLPRRYWRIAAILGNHLSDVVVGLWVYAMFQVAATEILQLTTPEVRFGGFLGMLLFLTTPLLFPAYARLKANNGRAPGLVLCTAYFTLLIWAIVNGSWAVFMAAALFFYLVILTSTFGAQVILFFGIPLSLYFSHLAPVAIPLSVFVVGWLVPPLGVRSLLIFKKHHTQMYFQKLRTLPAGKRNLVTNIWYFFYTLAHKDLFQAHRILFSYSPPLILLYAVPSLWFAIYLGLAYSQPEGSLSTSQWWSLSVSMTLASSVTFLLTSTGPGRIFGEAERYFEYSLPMICLGLTLWTYQSPLNAPLYLTVLIFLQLGLIPLLQLVQHRASVARLSSYNSMFKESIDPTVNDVVDTLIRQKGEVRVATVPMKLARLLSSLTFDVTDGRVKYYYHMMLSSLSLTHGMADYLADTDTAYSFKVPPKTLQAKYGIDYIVVDKDEVNRIGEKQEDNPFWQAVHELPILHENKRFIIYQLGSGYEREQLPTEPTERPEN